MVKWLLVAVVVIVVVVGGYTLLTKNSTAPAPTPAPTAMQEATATPAPSEAMKAEENTITLSKDGFSPATLTIKVGTKVTWKNMSGADATVSSDPHPVHTDYPPLNLGKFSDGGTHELTFDKSGKYGYHNHFNPTQKGTIIVQ
jgi:plastocyanin